MELCSGLCVSLDEREVCGRVDACVCVAEPVCSSPETTTTLLIGCTPMQSKKFQVLGETKNDMVSNCIQSMSFGFFSVVIINYSLWVVCWERREKWLW